MDNKNIQLVKDILGKDELYDSLAEEAAELAQAALKYKRAAGMSHNATPVIQETAKANVSEELCDILIAAKALGLDIPTEQEIIEHPKWQRWVDRLIDANARRMLYGGK